MVPIGFQLVLEQTFNLKYFMVTNYAKYDIPSWAEDDSGADSDTDVEVPLMDIYLPRSRDNEMWDYIHEDLLSLFLAHDVTEACFDLDSDDVWGVTESGFNPEPDSDDEVRLRDMYVSPLVEEKSDVGLHPR